MSLLAELEKCPNCNYSRSDEDVRRTGGSRVVRLFLDEARDICTQVDVENAKARSARGVPATGNVPREPYGEWATVVL